jgi:hypothetical protein
MSVRFTTPTRTLTLTLCDTEDYTEGFLDSMSDHKLSKVDTDKSYLQELGVDCVYVCDDETATFYESTVRDLQLASDTVCKLTMEQKQKVRVFLECFAAKPVNEGASIIFAAISEALKP